MIDYLVAGAIMVATVVATMILSSRSEYDGPDEPWLDWDGDVPDFTHEVKAPLRLHDVYLRTGAGWADHPDPEAVEAEKRRTWGPGWPE